VQKDNGRRSIRIQHDKCSNRQKYNQTTKRKYRKLNNQIIHKTIWHGKAPGIKKRAILTIALESLRASQRSSYVRRFKHYRRWSSPSVRWQSRHTSLLSKNEVKAEFTIALNASANNPTFLLMLSVPYLTNPLSQTGTIDHTHISQNNNSDLIFYPFCFVIWYSCVLYCLCCSL